MFWNSQWPSFGGNLPEGRWHLRTHRVNLQRRNEKQVAHKSFHVFQAFTLKQSPSTGTSFTHLGVKDFQADQAAVFGLTVWPPSQEATSTCKPNTPRTSYFPFTLSKAGLDLSFPKGMPLSWARRGDFVSRIPDAAPSSHEAVPAQSNGCGRRAASTLPSPRYQ